MKEIVSNKILLASVHNLVIVHYSCSSIDDKYPRISSISTYDTKLNLLKTFSRDNDSEKDEINTLEEFFTYISNKIDNGFCLVGWFWDDKYGIRTLINRYEQLIGKKPRINLSKLDYIDLLKILSSEYKEFFGGFKILAEYNGFNLDDFVDGPEEIELYKKGNFQKLNNSTSQKVEIFHNFIQRHIKKTLQVPKLEEIFYKLKDVGSYPVFNDSLRKINRLIHEKNVHVHDPELQTFLRNLLYANVITVMESYLSDTFIRKVIGDQKLLKKYISVRMNSKVNKKDMFEDFFEEIKEESNITLERYLAKKCIEDMKEIIFHNISVASSLYKEVLDIEFPKEMGEIYRAVDKRHHLIHRNGKDKEGKLILISIDQLQKLIKEVQLFVKYIHQKTKKLK